VRATVVEGTGREARMTWADVPDPVVGAGEVLVRVRATAVNRADILQRKGFYPSPPGASTILGLECSGTVEALGDGVESWSVGDEVCALLSGGGYAELVAVPAGQLMPVPDGVDLVTAAALPEVVCTVWSNVVMVAGLRPGETLLVHGGASGIGTCAIQLARELDARVAVTAGSARSCSGARSLGAQCSSTTTSRTSWRSCARPPADAGATSCSTTWGRTSPATSTCSRPTAASS
jgi:NADPH:quinone reductase-like Zn-dependent oxidoreductase